MLRGLGYRVGNRYVNFTSNGRADHVAIPESSSSINGGSALGEIHGSGPTKYLERLYDSR